MCAATHNDEHKSDLTRLIIERAHNAFISMDVGGLITEWNPSAERIFGWNKREVLGRRVAEVVMPERYREAHERGLEHFLATGEGPVLNKTIELEGIRRDGREFPIALTISPIELDGEYSFHAFVEDISERRESVRLIERANDQLIRADELKSRFLATMSHEIRTPMSVILGMADMLTGTSLSATQRTYLDEMQNAGTHLMGLIEGILDFSKIEAGELEFTEQPFDLAVVVEESIRLVAPAASEKHLALTHCIQPGSTLELAGDPARLRQVFVNLLANAVKFTESGHVRVEVDTAAVDDSRVRVEATVRDTGIGISGQVKGRLFEPFVQADASVTTRYGGTGLGLAICSRIVRAMDGAISVESPPGAGTSFHFSVVMRAAPAALGAATTQEPHGTESGPLSILVAEDHPVIQQLNVELLRRAGHDDVDVVDDGQKAVEAAGRRSYDVILMDMQMPGLDGVEAARQIRAGAGLGYPFIVAVTANAFQTDRERCLAAGMDEFLAKPIDSTLLTAMLSQVVERRSASH